jgi:antitoxin YefM
VGSNGARAAGNGWYGLAEPSLGQHSYQRIVTKQATSVRTNRVTVVNHARPGNRWPFAASERRRISGAGRTSAGQQVLADVRHEVLVTIIQVMTTIPLADAKARLSAVLDEVRDTHDRVVITRNGRPEAVIMSVSDLEALEETLDLLSTPDALDEVRAAEAEIARGETIGAEELRRLMEQRMEAEQDGE